MQLKPTLSRRQYEVVSAARFGLTNGQIAELFLEQKLKLQREFNADVYKLNLLSEHGPVHCVTTLFTFDWVRKLFVVRDSGKPEASVEGFASRKA